MHPGASQLQFCQLKVCSSHDRNEERWFVVPSTDHDKRQQREQLLNNIKYNDDALQVVKSQPVTPVQKHGLKVYVGTVGSRKGRSLPALCIA